MKRHRDSAALQCFLFEFHFIRVAIEAQDKPVATLTCLLNVSSSLVSVVMQLLTTRLRLPTLERSKGRTQDNDRYQGEERADDSNHYDIKITLAMRRSTNGE
jgi:hypothetical protein